MRRVGLFCIACLFGLTHTAIAAPEPEGIPKGSMYRYTDDKGRIVISNRLPKEALYLGYDIIDPNGRLVRQYEKALPEDERGKTHLSQKQKKQDRILLRLYSSPEDAVRARDRQLSSIRLKIGYAQNNIIQLNTRLGQEVSSAASYEKSGRDVPESVQASTDQFIRQINEQKHQIDFYNQDIEKIQKEFEPIIGRLEELKKEKESAPKRSWKSSTPENYMR